MEHRSEAVGREGLVLLIPMLTSEYLPPAQWVPVLAPNYFPLRSEYQFTLVYPCIRYVTPQRRDLHGTALLCYRNPAGEITVVVCEQKPYPVWCLAFAAWGDFHARSRFACSTIPEEKWGLLVV